MAPVSALHETPQQIRHTAHPLIQNGGWHFSSIGGPEAVALKMSSYSHQEPEVQKFNSSEHLRQCFERRLGIFCGDQMKVVSVDETFPRFVRENVQVLIDKGLIAKF